MDGFCWLAPKLFWKIIMIFDIY